jgi:5-methylcytosine-specific restriction endonuclease McrA
MTIINNTDRIKYKPLSEQPDSVIREIRAFRQVVKEIIIYRSKGYCEICNQPFGVKSFKLEGHHIIPPTKYKGENPNERENVVVCCKYCYLNHVLKGDKKWLNGGFKVHIRTADEKLKEIEYNKNSIIAPKTNIKKFFGIKFDNKSWHIRIGISLVKKTR